MSQSPQQWRGGTGETTWLSALVAAFEKLSDPEERTIPCDPATLTAAKAHLARLDHCHGFYGSRFSLRN